jgi:hypothetical protein
VSGENYIAMSFVLLTKHHSRDQIKNNEMGGEFVTNGREEGCVECFGGKT